MFTILVFALAAPTILPGPTAVDAERAFAADAQTIGQWRAFEKWAAEDAVMFIPQATSVHAFLKDRKNPPSSLEWAPAASYVSCDGKAAVNTGPFTQKRSGAAGYFTTVWTHGRDGWRWLLDHGDALPKAMPANAEPTVERASCKGHPKPPSPSRTAQEARGSSADGTLTWHWSVAPDGGRTFAADLWDGARYRPVVANQVKAP